MSRAPPCLLPDISGTHVATFPDSFPTTFSKRATNRSSQDLSTAAPQWRPGDWLSILAKAFAAVRPSLRHCDEASRRPCPFLSGPRRQH